MFYGNYGARRRRWRFTRARKEGGRSVRSMSGLMIVPFFRFFFLFHFPFSIFGESSLLRSPHRPVHCVVVTRVGTVLPFPSRHRSNFLFTLVLAYPLNSGLDENDKTTLLSRNATPRRPRNSLQFRSSPCVACRPFSAPTNTPTPATSLFSTTQ